jgi:hypothetical protein
MPTDNMLEKIGITALVALCTGFIGGRLFIALAKHFILKYFEGFEKKIDKVDEKNKERTDAAFERIKEEREKLREFRMMEFRDYKRDVALAIQDNKDSIKELYDRTDNHKEVAETVAFCNDRNKVGAS